MKVEEVEKLRRLRLPRATLTRHLVLCTCMSLAVASIYQPPQLLNYYSTSSSQVLMRANTSAFSGSLWASW